MDLDILINMEGSGTSFGYGYVHSDGGAYEDDEYAYRSVMFEEKVDSRKFGVPGYFQSFYEDAKTYVGEHRTLVDAVNDVLGFWYLGPVTEDDLHEEGAVHVASVNQPKEAARLIKERGLSFLVFYHEKENEGELE